MARINGHTEMTYFLIIIVGGLEGFNSTLPQEFFSSRNLTLADLPIGQ